MHMLSIVSRTEGNQAVKFGQLRQNNISNIFLEKAYTEYCEKTIPDPFLKIRNWAYLKSIVKINVALVIVF